jgi:hypothetical protein
MRKLAVYAARNRVGYLRNRSILEENSKLKALNAFLHLMDIKYRAHN